MGELAGGDPEAVLPAANHLIALGVERLEICLHPLKRQKAIVHCLRLLFRLFRRLSFRL